MKKEYIYVIMRHMGDYEDARSEAVCALRNKQHAIQHAKRMEDATRVVCKKLKTLQDAYFNYAEYSDAEYSDAEEKYLKYRHGNGTHLDRGWERETLVPKYAVYKLPVIQEEGGA